MSSLDPSTAAVPLAGLDPEVLAEGLATALAVPRFVHDVSAAAPFGTLGALLAAASAAAPLSPEEIDQALADARVVGERPTGDGTAAELSRREQSSADAADADLAAAIAAGNRAYEQRFDRVFLISAAGRTRAEILAELHRRLRLDDEAELRIVGEQLMEIAILRLTALFGGEPVAASATAPSPEPTSAPGLGVRG